MLSYLHISKSDRKQSKIVSNEQIITDEIKKDRLCRYWLINKPKLTQLQWKQRLFYSSSRRVRKQRQMSIKVH